MGRIEHEHPPVTVSKTPISEGGGAKSDAHDAPKAPKEPDLDRVVMAWPELPGHTKAEMSQIYARTLSEKIMSDMNNFHEYLWSQCKQ